MITNDPNIVLYHELPLCDARQIKADYEWFDFPDGRKVGVGRAKGEKGVFVRLMSPLGDGKTSLLRFRLSPEAALALAVLLQEQMILEPDAKQPEPPNPAA